MITFFDNVSPGVPGPNLKVTVATSDDFMLRKKPTVMRSRPIHQWRLLLQSKNINNYSNILGLGQDPLHDCCALDLHAAMPALVAGTNAGAPIRTNKSTLSNLIPKKS